MRTLIATARLLGIAALASAAATACTSTSAVPPTFGGTSLPSSESVPAKNAKHAKPLLYVAAQAAQAVFVYDQSEKSPAQPLYKITNGISFPNGLATDRSGNLYVTNDNSNTVTIYTPGSKSPNGTITSGVNTPFAIAVDSNGNIFVSNDPSGGSQNAYISEYLAGQTSPSYTWSPPQSRAVITGVALLNSGPSGESIEASYYTFDSQGNPHGDVMQCYSGNPSCSNDGYSFGRTGGIAVASSQALDLLVADQSAPGIWNLSASSTKLFSTSYDPWFMAFNPSHSRLFVSNGGAEVIEYAYPRMKVKKTFIASGGSEGPFVTGVAVSPAF